MLSSCYAASLSTIQGLRCLSMKGAEDIALANGRQIYTAGLKCQLMTGVEDIALANGGRFYTGGNEASEEFTDEDAVDDSSVHQPEKKRRLTFEQVKFLETNFELENKLEPDRKVQLAKDLNLQPRQVAVWFQNRRARWKTKQLEKDYDALKLNYNSMKADHESLLLENEQLQEEISSLTTKLLERPVNNDDWLESDCTARRQNLNGRKDGRESYTVPAQHCIEKKHGNDEKREASESSGSDQSGVCESDSPVPTDSGLSKGDGKKSDSKNPLVSTVEARADVSTCFEDVLSTNSFPHQFVKTEIEEDDQSHSYVFILEDQGAIPWGSFTWP